MPRPIVIAPALHCRIDLTKIGFFVFLDFLAATFLPWRAHDSGANKKTRRENENLFPSRPRA